MALQPTPLGVESKKRDKIPLSIWFFGTLGVLVVLSWSLGKLMRSTDANYFHYLAHAFNHGSLHLLETPPSVHDLTIVDGKLFLYWGPIPAVVLSPFVAVFGISWPDTWVTLVLGAAFSTLSLALLRRTFTLHGLEGVPSYLLIAVLTFGSPVLPLAISGGVWATSQLFAATFLVAGIWVACGALTNRSTLAATTLVGLACLCRPSMAAAGLWLLYRIMQDARDRCRAALIPRLIFASAILAACVGIQLAYNYGRFGDIFESGFASQNIAARFRADAALHGQMSITYLPKNLFYHYLSYPYPYSSQSLWGGSLFLMTPLYFGALFTLIKRGKSRYQIWPLWVACALIALPSLMVNGTGWIQIGPRYTVDYAPFLLLLVATGIRTWPTWLIILSSLLSIGHYLYGLFSFYL